MERSWAVWRVGRGILHWIPIQLIDCHDWPFFVRRGSFFVFQRRVYKKVAGAKDNPRLNELIAV